MLMTQNSSGDGVLHVSLGLSHHHATAHTLSQKRFTGRPRELLKPPYSEEEETHPGERTSDEKWIIMGAQINDRPESKQDILHL